MNNFLKIKKILYYMAIGFGSGLFFFAPGTISSIFAIFLWFFIKIIFPFKIQQVMVILLSFLLGVYICQLASTKLSFHDHSSIVWDEFVGIWITLIVLKEYTFFNIITSFFLFRFFDILKVWPINIIHKNIKNGLGIMLDDCLAGIYSCIILINFK